MLGVVVNALAIIVGSFIGLLCKKGIPERISKSIMTAVGLCVVYIAISGMLCGENTLVVVLAMVFGAAIGTMLDLDGKMNALGRLAEKQFVKEESDGSFAKGFLNASLLFCVGAMAIVGSLTAGLTGDNSVLYTKSVLDGIVSVILSASLGPGVMLSAVPIFVYQGLIAMLAGILSPVLSDAAINEMACTGYVIILGLGLNLLNLTKIKVADLMPAIILAPLLVRLIALFS